MTKSFTYPIISLMIALIISLTGYAQSIDTKGIRPANSNLLKSSAMEGGMTEIYNAFGEFYITKESTAIHNKPGDIVADSIRIGGGNHTRVHKAFLFCTSKKFSNKSIMNGEVSLEGIPLDWDGSAPAPSVGCNNYYTDVTDIVSGIFVEPILYNLGVTAIDPSSIEEIVLLVIYERSIFEAFKTVKIMFGALNTSGDHFSISLGQPIDPIERTFQLGMGFGIDEVSGNHSEVNINGIQLTSSTIGIEDKFYSLEPYIADTTTSLQVTTFNPTNEDNIFMAYCSIPTSVKRILLSQTTNTANVGTGHTIFASVLNDPPKPEDNRLITFKVLSGPNQGSSFEVTTNSRGKVFFTYPSVAAGTDKIQACYLDNGSETICSNVIYCEWIENQSELSYKFANPRINNDSGIDRFEFDVQVKANAAGTYLWSGLVNLSFNNASLSTDPSQWIVTKAGQFNANNSHGNPKYGIDLTITGASPDKILNIGFSGDANALNDPPTSADFVEVTNSYQTLVTLSAQITDQNGVAGIDFIEADMNGEQFYKISSDPYFAAYTNPNVYGEADFMDTYVGRVFSVEPQWTQVGGLNWAYAVNTSVWDGTAIIPFRSYFNAKALRIHNPAHLTISPYGMMNVTGDTEIKTINGLTIQSDYYNTGSFITRTASGVGSALAGRYLTTDAWHIVSSPLADQSISNFLSSNPNIATSEDNEVRGMMDYNPVLNAWNDYFTNSTAGTLETGKGFCMRSDANSAVTFAGSLQAGNLSATGLTPEKWNCVGNPYTSAIGINIGSWSKAKFLVENESNLDDSYGAIYVWNQPDASNGQYGMYSVISNASENWEFDVQQGQAFLVKMKAGKTSVNFTSGMQIHDPSLAFKSAKNSWPTIKLIASENSQKSSTTIAFNQKMTKGLDKTYDAGLFKGGSDLVVYSRLVEDNGIPFAIQALPDNDFSNMVIPIGLDFNTGGDVVFTADLINLPSDCQVILEDKISKTFTDLSYKDYTATIAANSSIADRFRLHTSYLTTGLDMETLAGKLSAYAVRNIEMIVRGDVSSEAVASVYDLLGRLILTKQLDAGSRNVIGLPMLKTGIYMLHVRDNGKVQAFKVMVKE